MIAEDQVYVEFEQVFSKKLVSALHWAKSLSNYDRRSVPCAGDKRGPNTVSSVFVTKWLTEPLHLSTWYHDSLCLYTIALSFVWMIWRCHFAIFPSRTAIWPQHRWLLTLIATGAGKSYPTRCVFSKIGSHYSHVIYFTLVFFNLFEPRHVSFIEKIPRVASSWKYEKKTFMKT